MCIRDSSFTVRLVAQDSSGSAIDLTNWSLRGYAKIKYSEANLLVDLDPKKVSPNSSGQIDIQLTAATTSTLPVTEGVYDIEIYDASGYVDKVVVGYIRVHPETTY